VVHGTFKNKRKFWRSKEVNQNKSTQLPNNRKAVSLHTNINIWCKPKIIQVTRKLNGHATAQAVMTMDSHCRVLGLKPNDFM
jgi:hypothetical protein